MTDFQRFTDEYGPAAEIEKPADTVLGEFASLVPDQVIEFWSRFGFGRYLDGVLWILNPKQLEGVLAEWLPEQSRGVPIARTAFGKVLYWDKNQFTLLDVNFNDRFSASDNTEVVFNYFLVGEDARLGILQEPLFKKALRKFGPLKPDEMYGYKLPLALGGDRALKNMEKMRMREQLSILAQIHEAK
jgi:hypothetical protein